MDLSAYGFTNGFVFYGFDPGIVDTFILYFGDDFGLAEDVAADLIAIGTKQRRGLGHFLAGSIAEDVVNHATVPVWTYGLENE